MKMNNEIINAIPPMKTGIELSNALTTLPQYDKNIVNENTAVRLIALSDLFNVYIPSQMSLEIYSKLYLALLRSLQKKYTKTATVQQYQNYRLISGQDNNGIIGGSDSFTIIGVSGIGKSSAINKAITVITENKIIEIEKPYAKIIPCIVVQCPFDASVKGLLLEILRKVDECLDSNYYANAVRMRATTDMLIGSVSQVALNHIGLLIVDEIQNVCNNRNGKSLVGMLTQLINNSGISICMVGTPESSIFFEQAIQLARRSLGLTFSNLKYNDYFKEFCNQILYFQYVKQPIIITEGLYEWLYEHSAGITSIVVTLIHDGQEIAILNGTEELNFEVLNEAYKNRMALLHDYIQPPAKSKNRITRENIHIPDESISEGTIDNPFLFSKLAARTKHENSDIVTLLKDYICVSEVVI